MPKQPMKNSTKALGLFLLCLIIAGALALWLRPWISRHPEPQPLSVSDAGPTATAPASPVASPATAKKEPVTVIGKQAIKEDGDLKNLVTDRKARFGIDKGVDFIAGPDEAIVVGGITVPMSEIIEKIRLKRGDIIENEIDGGRTRAEIERDLQAVQARIREAEMRAGSKEQGLRLSVEAEINELNAQQARLGRELDTLNQGLDPDAQVELYGIYVVRPNDNIWNIHFNFLKELFRHKAIAISPLADEPTDNGQSSGVGKLLKFSESMVAIYNVRERRLDSNLELITPDSKVVVFNFNKVFSTLDQIDYKNINHIKFDGETIWIPAVQ